MAVIFPKDEDQSEFPYSEKLVYEQLSKLDNSFTVFHSVEWTKKRNRKTTLWKENDFLILHPDLGMLVLEIKGGEIRYTDGVFHQIDITSRQEHVLSEEKRNDPLTQAKDGKFHYQELFDAHIRGISNRFPIEAAVWFTHSDITEKLNEFPLKYRELSGAILDSTDLVNGNQNIEDVFYYYDSDKKTRISDAEYQTLINLIAGDFNLVVAPEIRKGEIDHTFLQLTREQLSLLDYISEQRSATIQGVAGTGKTIIAKEAAKRFAESDRKVLFLCFNHFLLVDLIKRYPNKNIEFCNINSFISKFTKIDTSSPSVRSAELVKIPFSKLKYDDVIIDEAQDFENEEIEYFGKYTEQKNGHFLIFYDKNQLVTTRSVPDWIVDSNCKLVLTKNCRNTREIAITAYNVIDTQLDQQIKMVVGEKPSIVFDQRGSLDGLTEIIHMLKGPDYGFVNSEIAILTLKTEKSSILTNRKAIAGCTLSQDRNDSAILFTTARKFKGLESRVVIITDITKEDFEDDEYKRVFYVACSRATQKLILVMNCDDSEINEIANTISKSKRFAPKGKIAMRTKCNILDI